MNRTKKSYPVPLIILLIVILVIVVSLSVFIFTKLSSKEEENVVEIEETTEIDEELLVLVNKEKGLEKEYVPENLIIPEVEFSFEDELEKSHLREEAAKALEEMFNAAKEEDINLFFVSGYRSYERQEEVYNNKVENSSEEEANQLVAKPGYSEHQTGLAVDISSAEIDFALIEDFENTKEGQWLRVNAPKFGFILRYDKGKEEITGYKYEPWHFRYVGKIPAMEIFEGNLTLEEYLEKNNNE